jgi:hypothetical protein
MEEVLESIENVLALLDSIAILAVAHQYGAGDLSPQSLKRLANEAGLICEQVKERMGQLTLGPTDSDPSKKITIQILKKA